MVFQGNPEFGVDLQPIDFAEVCRGLRRRRFPLRASPTKCGQLLEAASPSTGRRWSRRWSTRTSRRMPGHATLEQACRLPRRWSAARKTAKIIKTVFKDKIKRVI